jgi:hypothetical protein
MASIQRYSWPTTRFSEICEKFGLALEVLSLQLDCFRGPVTKQSGMASFTNAIAFPKRPLDPQLSKPTQNKSRFARQLVCRSLRFDDLAFTSEAFAAEFAPQEDHRAEVTRHVDRVYPIIPLHLRRVGLSQVNKQKGFAPSHGLVRLVSNLVLSSQIGYAKVCNTE